MAHKRPMIMVRIPRDMSKEAAKLAEDIPNSHFRHEIWSGPGTWDNAARRGWQTSKSMVVEEALRRGMKSIAEQAELVQEDRAAEAAKRKKRGY